MTSTTSPRAEVESTKVISMRPSRSNCWGTLARRSNGDLLYVCSGGREEHVCPFGRSEFMRSSDEGHTWSFPRVLLDGPLDNRDCGVLETDKGTLLVATFTSVGYQERLAWAEQVDPGDELAWPKEKLERWQAAHRQATAADRELLVGSFLLRSTDGGASWSAPYRCPINSPHGPVQLSDGRQLYAGKISWSGASGEDAGRIGVCESTDDGVTWRWLAEIPTRPGDSLDGYSELHSVETTDGGIVAHIRNDNEANRREILQTESADGGSTWSTPRAIGVWGFPSHLLRLRDGRLVMTYGHRRQPLGNQARVSEDHGRTWSEAMIVSGDGTSSDIGYPSTVELNDGSLLTVWYELMGSPPEDFSHYLELTRDEVWFKMTRDVPRAVLRQARWSIR